MRIKQIITKKQLAKLMSMTICLAVFAAAPRMGARASDNPVAFNAALGNGINLGNALEAPKEGDWGVTLQPEYFELIKKAGFSHVRVPIRWSTHAMLTAPYTIEPAFFERVDWVIQQASRQSLNVVLNMHHYEEFEKDPDNQRARFISMWHQIAEHFKQAPRSVAFEIYNEPSHAIDASKWNAILLEALHQIREENHARFVVVGPVRWNSISALPTLELPADDQNLIVTVHYYEPFHFTHQGASWAGPESKDWLGTKWTDTRDERARINTDFDTAAAWGASHHRPLYLGEYGAYEKADMDSRARWTRAVRQEADRRKFATAYWEFCSGFGAYDPNAKQWREPLLHALTEH